jgi:shikimate dehydrogenase
MTALYAVAGNPVFHSRSPVMFNTAFRELAVEATYLRLAASTPEEIVTTAREMDLQGLNITTPFKTGVMRYLDFVEADAERVGAVNTVVKRPEGLVGCNTDIAGALGAAESIGFMPSQQKVVVLGAGGAARAAAFAFVRAGAHVVIANRTFEKARDAALRLGCEAVSFPHVADALKDARLLVSAISSTDRVLDPSLLRPELIVLEALYSGPTSLLRDAAGRGCTVIDGREWLLAQAAPAFSLFTGQPAPLGEMRKALWKKKLDSRRNIALVGFMATGKSTVAELVAARGGLTFIDIDKDIEEKAGASIAEIFERSGEEVFRRMEQAAIDGLRLVSHHAASCGGGALTVRSNVRTLRNNCLTVWLWANMSTILERAGDDRSRPCLFGLDAKSSRDLIERRLPQYAACADLLINTEGKKPEEIAERIWDEVHHAFSS